MNSRSNMVKVAVVGGEGVGPAVTATVASDPQVGDAVLSALDKVAGKEREHA
jgi:hypothetical protein